jgi:acetyl-CoA carboxylase biotin carboxyl carrier protein
VTIHINNRTDFTPRKGLNGEAPVAPPPAHSVLDSVCRSATELAKAVPKPPHRIRLQYGQTSVEVEWSASESVPVVQEVEGTPTGPPDDPDSAGLHYLCAPTVGTFYHSPEPGAPPYVSEGDVVRPGQTVGVLEVMKMMSPVEADTAGRVVEIIAPNAHPVEFQQQLIAVAPLTPPAQPAHAPEG